MPGFGGSGFGKSSKNDCSNAGFPINYEALHEVKAETDTDAAPLVPAAAFEGVMSGLDVVNESCNDLVIEVEYYSSNSDCDGCSVDKPLTKIQKHTVPKGTHYNFAGLVVDYSITAGVMLQDGCFRVMSSRVTSTCCALTGVTTTLNGLVVPTI